ncbi:hypothetical protein An14g04270 [Aspergillus niger]|uniref:Uncharacterized protein n=2 Tax=Aspergillus niger TaxID=5061 RepID=A2R3H1_ASPNC|nr:hypothetical protein An14g04270 [Aspergillus niger]CAK48519.1 hypothetical protein An14g04270 [Aspergillus niger]
MRVMLGSFMPIAEWGARTCASNARLSPSIPTPSHFIYAAGHYKISTLYRLHSIVFRPVQQHGYILVHAATSSSWIRLSPHVIQQILAISHGMIIRDYCYSNKQSYCWIFQSQSSRSLA